MDDFLAPIFNGLLKRFKDMGDGTHAETVTVAGLTVTADTINLDTSDLETKIGAVTEAAPATDTASSGLNGRLQRIAQRLTTMLTGIVLAAGSAIIGKVIPIGVDGANAASATNGVPASDAGPSWTSAWGISNAPFTSADQHSAVASVTGAPTSGQKLVLDDLVVSVDTTMSVTFKEETSGTVILGPLYIAANSGGQITFRGKRKLPVADKKLQVITSVAGNIMVLAGYHSEA